MCDYLARREGRYYFRRPIPLALRLYFGGKSQWMLSLRTADPAEGKRRAQEETARTNALLDDAQRQRAAGVIPAAQSTGPSMTAQELGRGSAISTNTVKPPLRLTIRHPSKTSGTGRPTRRRSASLMLWRLPRFYGSRNLGSPVRRLRGPRLQKL
ncbi:DUF6538 domain-containing protein [Sphingomonas sp.]|uniref:DUF6538 domain-containing protein n=1 Tax=Sphingomonas sp. TaxID=28214 RepID=UPI00345D15A4